MHKYTEYQKLTLDKEIADLSEEKGKEFALIYKHNSKGYGTALAVSLLTVIGVPFFYFGFGKFKAWIIALWVVSLLMCYIGIGVYMLIGLTYYMIYVMFQKTDEHNYGLKEYYLHHRGQANINIFWKHKKIEGN